MEDPAYSRLAKVISVILMTVILVSTVCFVLESEVQTCSPHGGPCAGFLEFEPWAKFFYVVEWISVIIFTLEYCVRIGTCPSRYRFLTSALNFVDLVAWLPFWVIEGLNDPPYSAPSLDKTTTPGFGFVRAIRLIRVFRVFKFGKYSIGIRMFSGAILHSAQPMAVLCAVLTVATIIFSSLIWLLERPQSRFVTDELLAATGMADMQIVCFGTIPSSFWWALTTMTTVGYGDCFPITLPGKMVTVVAMVCGVIVLALPITVLGSNFSKMMDMYAEDRAECTLVDAEGNGLIEELELREFLLTKKRSGLLRKDVDTKTKTLMSKYDRGKKGALTFDEFIVLQHDVLIDNHVDPMVEVARMRKSLDEQERLIMAMSSRLAALEEIKSSILSLSEQMKQFTSENMVSSRSAS
uniref:EF-hand domain-containing protein n=2 Tax=Chrysotila carterae TaxID=13221 RepID=A0A7S4B011_CHRCT